MAKGTSSAYLPVGIVFGIAAFAFLLAGNAIWVAFFPLALTFLVLSSTKRDDDAPDAGASDDGQVPPPA